MRCGHIHRRLLTSQFDCSRFIHILILTALLFPLILNAQSNDGVYGGYVGSTDWFRDMRQHALNQAMLRSLGSRSTTKKGIPPGYVEVAGLIQFRTGINPFPKGRFPDLRIVPLNRKVDSVERAPFINDDGSFYSILKRGTAYDVQWMYYFGSRETWARIHVDAEGPTRDSMVLPYPNLIKPDSTSRPNLSQAPGQNPDSAVVLPPVKPPDAETFDTSKLPNPPQTFQQQCVWEEIRHATTPTFKAAAHNKLAEYYESIGEKSLAEKEKAKGEYWKTVKD